MRKILFIISLFVIPCSVWAQEEDDDGPGSYNGKPVVEKPWYPNIFRIGVYANPVFSTSRIRSTNYYGTHESRLGYTPFTFGLSLRGDFNTWGIETGVASTERRLSMTAGNSRSPYSQRIFYSANMACIDIPLIVHPILVHPDEYTVISPYVGFSLNLLHKTSAASSISSATSDPTASLTNSLHASVPSMGYSFMFGTSLIKTIPIFGKLDVGVGYQVDLANLPNVETKFTYTNTSGINQSSDYKFKTINQGIRIRVVYYFFNRPKFPYETYEEYAEPEPLPNTPEYEMGPPLPPSLEP